MFDLEGDARSFLARLDLQRVDQLPGRPSLLDLDQDLIRIRRPNLNRPVEGAEAHFGSSIGCKSLLFADDLRLRIDADDAGRRRGTGKRNYPAVEKQLH